MSSRALRRLREEKEAQEAQLDNDDDDDEDDDEDEDGDGGGNKAFLMMLEEESSSSEEEDSDSESDDNDHDGDDAGDNHRTNIMNNKGIGKSAPPPAPPSSKIQLQQQRQQEEETEEDLDAILSDMNIQPAGTSTKITAGNAASSSSSSRSSSPASTAVFPHLSPFYKHSKPSIRFTLLSKQANGGGFDARDLDLDYAMRSLLGGGAAGGGGGFDGNNIIMEQQQQQQQQQGARGRNRNNKGGGRQIRTLAKKYLFGKPKVEWGKPPSYIGGGLGMVELSPHRLEEEDEEDGNKNNANGGNHGHGRGGSNNNTNSSSFAASSWSVPWPYDLEVRQMEELEQMEREGTSWYGVRRDDRDNAAAAAAAARGAGGKGEEATTTATTTATTSKTTAAMPSPQDANSCNTDTTKIPTIPLSLQKWYTLQMSDTYQEHVHIYEQMAGSHGGNGGGGNTNQLQDPNALALFVADYPYFAETLLQLAMVLYYINDRGRGNDLLRRCMFLYETALPSSVLPSSSSSSSSATNNNNNNNSNDGKNNNNNNILGGNEILIDIERQPNSGLFATLFRIMQTSGMSGCYPNALAVGRFLLSLDPLRDPMGVLLILDYYALASRRRSSGNSNNTAAGANAGEGQMEMGSSFIVHLVESNLIHIHYMDPLTSRHHWCPLTHMPNWAFSKALALYRLSKDEIPDQSQQDDNAEATTATLEQRAEEALIQALTRFPMVLSKLLTMNNVNTQDRSFQTDWPSVLPYFNGDAMENNGSGVGSNSVEKRVTKAAGEHVVRIFVQRCYKFWGDAGVLQWLYRCCAKMVQQLQQQSLPQNEQDAENGTHAGNDPTAETQNGTPATTINRSKYFTSTFSPALARYAQCDPSEYEDAFRTFPPEAIALDPNMVAPAMALNPNRRGRFLRGANIRAGGMGRARVNQEEVALMDQLRGLLAGNNGQQEMEMLDPDSPLLQLYLQSLLPWAQVDGVRPPRG